MSIVWINSDLILLISRVLTKILLKTNHFKGSINSDGLLLIPRIINKLTWEYRHLFFFKAKYSISHQSNGSNKKDQFYWKNLKIRFFYRFHFDKYDEPVCKKSNLSISNSIFSKSVNFPGKYSSVLDPKSTARVILIFWSKPLIYF